MFYYPTTFLKGERIDAALKESRRFQWRRREAIAEYQLSKARELVFWAKNNSLFYRDFYDGIDPMEIQSRSDFAQLPTINKSDLIDHEPSIQTNFGGRYEAKTTGGSTGHPVKVLKNSNALAMERAVTWRAYEWAGVEVGDPQGRFWGVPHNRKGRLKAFLTDLVANRKRVSAFKLNADSLKMYYAELKAFKPTYLYGYVSVIETLADYVAESCLPPISSVKSIITTSEVLYPRSREKIESAFGVKVYNEYGCGEVGSIAHECEHGQMHIMADNILLEIDGDGEGEILVTDFYNYKTPIIRYRIGDYGSLSDEPCSCGRTLPVLSNVYGRAYDLIRLANGTSIHPESLIYVIEDFKSEADAISQFQAVQTSLNDVEINVVPKAGWTDSLAGRLEQQMKKHLSNDLNYRINPVESLHRERSGKMRLVKSLVV